MIPVNVNHDWLQDVQIDLFGAISAVQGQLVNELLRLPSLNTPINYLITP